MGLAGGGGPVLTQIIERTATCTITLTSAVTQAGAVCTATFTAFAQTPTVRGITLPASDIGQAGSRTSITGDFSFISPGAVPVTWTGMPAALTEFLGTAWHEGAMDFTPTDDCNTVVNVVVAGTAGAILKIQYSSDGGTTWADVMPGQDVSIAAAGLQINGNMIVAAGARIVGGVLIRLVGSGRNGVVSPQFGDIELFCASQVLQMPTLSYSLLTASSVSLEVDCGFICPNFGQTIIFHPAIDLCFPCSN